MELRNKAQGCPVSGLPWVEHPNPSFTPPRNARYESPANYRALLVFALPRCESVEGRVTWTDWGVRAELGLSVPGGRVPRGQR